jgi:hypothetical protein
MFSTKKLLAVAILLTFAGCGHGSSGGPNGAAYVSAQSQINIPAPQPQPTDDGSTTILVTPLTVYVTNGSTATISVTGVTPDETFDLGWVNPGETITAALDELPANVTLFASAVSTDQFGQIPSFDSKTMQFGFDYSATYPYATVQWTDGGAVFDTLSTGSATAQTARRVSPRIAHN